MIAQTIAVILIFTLSNATWAQRTSMIKERRTIQSIVTETPVIIDGLLDEMTWKKAPITSNFTQIEPKPGTPANFLTEVQSAYDEQYLYFGIIAHDSVKARRYRAPDMRRDFSFQSHDLVGITIDGFNDGRNSMTFFVNAYGAQRDYLSFDDSYFDVDWNGLWKVKTTRHDSLWIAEFAIPWKTLRYKFSAHEQQQFGINFQRVRRTSNERSAWSPYPRGVGFNRMEHVGVISGFIPPVPTTNVQLNPYSLMSHYTESDLKIKAGGEVKWAINPSLVVDATLNTDFAQADVDQRVNNITRFSVLFPEKRQFFLENASLFGVGISGDEGSHYGNISLIPFFSRRIGLDNNNRPIPIAYGGRVVYRSDKRSYGGMFMQQKQNEINPQTHHLVARYSENIGRYSRLGFVATSKMTDATDTTMREQSYTAAADGLVRINASNWLTGMVAMTKEMHSGYKAGAAGYLKYEVFQSNLNAWITTALIDKRFNPESGFISRTNVYAITPGMQLNLRDQWLPHKKKLRDFTPEVALEFYYDASTNIPVEQNLKLTPIAYNFIKGGQVSLSFLHNYQNIISDFLPLGVRIHPGKYRFNRLQAKMSSDGSKSVSYNVIYELGSYFNGRLSTVNFSLLFAPDPHFSLKAMLNSNHFKKVGVEDSNQTVNLYTINSRIAANPRLQLDLNYQKDTREDLSIYNIRLSWEYKPLSFIYFVYNGKESSQEEIAAERNAILKVSLLKQL
jgi:hypothetical protein